MTENLSNGILVSGFRVEWEVFMASVCSRKVNMGFSAESNRILSKNAGSISKFVQEKQEYYKSAQKSAEIFAILMKEIVAYVPELGSPGCTDLRENIVHYIYDRMKEP